MQRWRAGVSVSSMLASACAGGATERDAPQPPSLSAAVAPAPASAPVVAPTPNAAPNAAPEAPARPPDDPWAPLLREVAASYGSWGLVDDQFHWAPGLCAMPARGVQHYSEAPSPAAHAEKVFVLYALDPMAYWKATDVKGRLPGSLQQSFASIGSRTDVVQVLVKESFVPRAGHHDPRLRSARKGDQSFGAGDPIGLFVMAQIRDAPPDTDQGWIYATVAPGGEVTASGVIAACRDCHAQQSDRVFGMPLHWK